MVDSRLIESRGDNIHIASHRIGGAFFVNAGALFYLYGVGVSVPLLGTRFIETPEVSCVRSIIQAMLFAILFYLGFIRTWKRGSTGRSE